MQSFNVHAGKCGCPELCRRRCLRVVDSITSWPCQLIRSQWSARLSARRVKWYPQMQCARVLRRQAAFGLLHKIDQLLTTLLNRRKYSLHGRLAPRKNNKEITSERFIIRPECPATIALDRGTQAIKPTPAI